jgi:hypothetical protein
LDLQWLVIQLFIATCLNNVYDGEVMFKMPLMLYTFDSLPIVLIAVTCSMIFDEIHHAKFSCKQQEQ